MGVGGKWGGWEGGQWIPPRRRPQAWAWWSPLMSGKARVEEYWGAPFQPLASLKNDCQTDAVPKLEPFDRAQSIPPPPRPQTSARPTALMQANPVVAE